ncbi:Protein FAR1-RELATED SEQUENCE [Abeliophyllum distichum]|uniref:Protein FAR1-RELATED SEQUENCE n=1 Tax=Abeliophyllum distichum TaxID=126358 RepID=A0ABD1NVP0_9LAMI
MSSNQRSESGHSFFKKYVNRKNSLMGFITRFNRALTHQRHEELVCNHVDLNERPRVISMVMMEEQMVRIYTKKIFLLFQKEIGESNKYICTKKTSCISIKMYLVQRFESGSNFQRQRELTDARSTYLQGEFEKLHLRIKEIDIDGHNGIPTYSSKSRESQQLVEDPSEVRAKGCGKRMKSSKEKAMSKGSRQCSVCGGAGHDKRTCPTLNSRFNIGTDDVANEPYEDATFTTVGSSNFQFGF